MTTLILDPDSLTDRLQIAGDKGADNLEAQVASRRYMDAINSLGRILNLERRDSRRERRFGKVAQYTGPALRIILDRRESPSERRKLSGQT